MQIAYVTDHYLAVVPAAEEEVADFVGKFLHRLYPLSILCPRFPTVCVDVVVFEDAEALVVLKAQVLVQCVEVMHITPDLILHLCQYEADRGRERHECIRCQKQNLACTVDHSCTY